MSFTIQDTSNMPLYLGAPRTELPPFSIGIIYFVLPNPAEAGWSTRNGVFEVGSTY